MKRSVHMRLSHKIVYLYEEHSGRIRTRVMYMKMVKYAPVYASLGMACILESGGISYLGTKDVRNSDCTRARILHVAYKLCACEEHSGRIRSVDTRVGLIFCTENVHGEALSLVVTVFEFKGLERVQ